MTKTICPNISTYCLKRAKGYISFRLLIAFLFLLITPASLLSTTPQLQLSEEEQAWLATHPSIQVGVGVAFPPFMWVEEEGDSPLFKGIVADYVNLLSEKLGVEMVINLDIPFNEALQKGQAREIDFFPLLSVTPERSTYLLFTEPYLSYPMVIITRDDSASVEGLADLVNKRFAVVKHLVIYSKIKQDYPDLNLEFVYTKTISENLELVATGRADACIINLAAASSYIYRKGLTNLKIAAEVDWDPITYSMAVRSDWPIFRSIVEKAVASLSEKQKEDISKRWITIKYDTGIDTRLVIRWLAGIVLGITSLITLFFFWHRSLAREIKDKEKAKQTLLESEEKLRNIVVNSTNLFFSRTIDHRNTYISPQSWEYLQCSPEDALIDWCEFLTDNPINTKGLELSERATQTGQRQPPYHLELIGKKGKILTVEVREVPIIENGKTVSFVGSFSDITEQKRYEQELLASRKEWEDIFQAIGSPAMLLEPDLTISKANKATLDLTGMTNAQIHGRKCCEVFHGTSQPPSPCPVHSIMVSKTHTSAEMEINIKKGTFLVSYTPVLNQDGDVEKIIHIATDITRSKQLERQLSHTNKMEAIGNLAGGIAHDFNNVLTAIIGFTELALDESKKGSELEDNLQEVYASGKRAKELVNQILAFARQTEEKAVPVQPGILAREVTKFLRSSIPTTIDIIEHINTTSYIMASPVHIHQVLMNLSTNAAQAMASEGGTLTIEMKDVVIGGSEKLSVPNLRAGDYMEIRISDTGVGISPEIIDSIFEPYYTTKAPGEGTGVGLALVQGIVELYQGRVFVDSIPGEGSSFTVYLPLTSKRGAEKDYQQTPLPKGSEKILLIDDEESVLKVTSRILQKQGYRVTTSRDSIEALEMFQNNPEDFDLIITDMTMPGMTGVQIAEKILELRPDLPVILCTGYSSQVSHEAAEQIGIRAFTYKPVVKAEFINTVRMVLDEA